MNISDPVYYDTSNVAPPDITECFAVAAGQALNADLYTPAAACRHGAAVLFLHGGGWTGGKRQGFLWHAHRLALRGYLTCTVDYRLAPDHRYPAAVEDCRTALDWLIKQADRFHIQPDRIGVVGSSAGGHLAACLGVSDPAHQPPSPPRVACVVDVHGLHDLPAMIGHKNAELCEMFTGGSLDEKRGLWEAASPLRHVGPDAAPMLITHDPSDQSVPYDQSTMLVEALCRSGCPVQFIPTPGSGHGFFYNPSSPWVPRIWPAAVEWLDRFLLCDQSGAQHSREKAMG